MSQTRGLWGRRRGRLFRIALALLLPLLTGLCFAAGPVGPASAAPETQPPDCQAGGLPAGYEGWEDTYVLERRLTHDAAFDVNQAMTGEVVTFGCGYTTKPVGSGWGVGASAFLWVEYDCQPDRFLQTQYVWQQRENDIYRRPTIPVSGRTATTISGQSDAYEDGGRHLIYTGTRVLVPPLGTVLVLVSTQSINPPAPAPMQSADFVDMATRLAQTYMPIDTLGQRCGLSSTPVATSTPGTTLGVKLACQSNFADPGLVVCTAAPVNARAGAAITYRWSLDGQSQSATGSELRLTGVSAGRHTVTVTATDSASSQSSAPESVTVDKSGAGTSGGEGSPLDPLLPLLVGGAVLGLAGVAVGAIVRNARGKPRPGSTGGRATGAPPPRPGGPAGSGSSGGPGARPGALPEMPGGWATLPPIGDAPTDLTSRPPGGSLPGPATAPLDVLPARPSALPEAGSPSWLNDLTGGAGAIPGTVAASVVPLGAAVLASPPAPPAEPDQQSPQYWFEADPGAITVRGDGRDVVTLRIRVKKRVGTLVTDAPEEAQVSVRSATRAKVKVQKLAGGLDVLVCGLHLGTAPADGLIEISGIRRATLQPIAPLQVPVRVSPVPAQVRITALKDGFHFQSHDETLTRSCGEVYGYVTALRGPGGEENETIAHARCVAEVNVDGHGWVMFGQATTDGKGLFAFTMHSAVVALFGADLSRLPLDRPVQMDLSESSRTALKTYQTYAATIPGTPGFATAREQYARYPGVFFRQLCRNEEKDAKKILSAILLLCRAINYAGIYRKSFEAQRSCIRTAIGETFGALTSVVIEFTEVVGLAWDFAHAVTHPNVLGWATREVGLGRFQAMLFSFSRECTARWQRWVIQTNELRRRLAKNLQAIWRYAKPSALPEFVSSSYEAEVTSYLRSRAGAGAADAAAHELDALLVKLVVGLVVTLVAVAMLPVYLITVLMLVVFVLLHVGASAIRAVGDMFRWGGVAGGREALIDAIEKGLSNLVGALYDRIWGWNDAVRTHLMALPPGRGTTTPDLGSWIMEGFPTVDDFDPVMGRALEEALYLSEHLLVPEDWEAAVRRVNAAEAADREAAVQWAEKVRTAELAVAGLQLALAACSGMGYVSALILSRGVSMGLGGLARLMSRFASGEKELARRAEHASLRFSSLCDKVGAATEFGLKSWILWQAVTDLEVYRHVPQRRIGDLYRREEAQGDGR